MNWQQRILERTQSSFKYRVCTDSIAKTAGTPKRSKWSKAAKRRYDRCLKKVTESRENPWAGPDPMAKRKPSIKKGDQHKDLPPKLRAVVMARKALEGGGVQHLGRLGSK